MSGCQSGRKMVPHNSKSDLPLVHSAILLYPTRAYLHIYFHALAPSINVLKQEVKTKDKVDILCYGML